MQPKAYLASTMIFAPVSAAVVTLPCSLNLPRAPQVCHEFDPSRNCVKQFFLMIVTLPIRPPSALNSGLFPRQ